MQEKYYYNYKINNFDLTIAEEEGYITIIKLHKESLSYKYLETPLIKRSKEELAEYFNHKRTTFDIPLKLTGTPFQNKVWTIMQEILYGKTATYKDLALKLGNKNYARAVGNACNKNKIVILIPCHRVIGTNNKGGFYYGLKVKEELLKIEKI